jgi:hypothetical protein
MTLPPDLLAKTSQPPRKKCIFFSTHRNQALKQYKMLVAIILQTKNNHQPTDL